MYNASELDFTNPAGKSKFGNRIEELKISHDGIVVKLLPDLKSADGGKPPLFFTSYLYQHQAGPSPLDTRSHPSLRPIFGEDPEFVAFKELNAEVTVYVKASGLKGDDLKDDPTFKKLKKRADMLRPRVTYLMNAYERGGNKVKALRVSESLKGILFGKDAKEDAPAIVGVIPQMIQEYEMNPFDNQSDGGWIRIWKTGAGLETRYFAEPYQVMVKNAKGKPTRQASDEPTPAAIRNLKEEDVPDLKEFHSQYHWTLEEAQAYVASVLAGKPCVPEKAILKKHRTQSSSTAYDVTKKTTTSKLSYQESEDDSSDEDYEAPVVKKSVSKPTAKSVKVEDESDDLDTYLES